MNSLVKLRFLQNPLQPLQVTDYLIKAVKVVPIEAPNQRIEAKAKVIVKDSNGIWDHSSLQIIELKHCYNRYSRGPKSTTFDNLIGCILTIKSIKKADYGDLDIVTWELQLAVNSDVKVADRESGTTPLTDEEYQLIFDEQQEISSGCDELDAQVFDEQQLVEADSLEIYKD